MSQYIEQFELKTAKKRYDEIELPGELDFVIRKAIVKAQTSKKNSVISVLKGIQIKPNHG